MSAFEGEFFAKRISAALVGDQGCGDAYEKELSIYLMRCKNIIYNEKFSQIERQRMFESSVVESCLARLNNGRLLSAAQKDLIDKMHRRKGPVSFCGHRK